MALVWLQTCTGMGRYVWEVPDIKTLNVFLVSLDIQKTVYKKVKNQRLCIIFISNTFELLLSLFYKDSFPSLRSFTKFKRDMMNWATASWLTLAT